MLAYKIESIGAFPFDSNPKSFTLKNLSELKERLANSKNALDVHFKDKRFQYAWSALDPFRDERGVVSFIGNIKPHNVVTNAWLKCYEMLNYFKIVDQESKKYSQFQQFVHFDNASFPGTFILATHHYIATKEPALLPAYQWYGSSLIEENSDDKEPLEDKFGLMKKYPDHWLMNNTQSNINGDVLDERVQKHFEEKLAHNVDLYTSDLGFDVSSDYNKQEIFHAKANAGQILSGLLTLKPGGTLVTKQYTFFEGINISIIYGLSFLFKEFYIAKPATSRAANSEVYLVGKGFLLGETHDKIEDKTGINKIHEKMISLLFDVINGKINTNVSLFNPADIPKKFLAQIIKASCEIFERQIKVVDENVKQAIHDKDWSRKKRSHKDDKKEKLVKEWYENNFILPISDDDKLF